MQPERSVNAIGTERAIDRVCNMSDEPPPTGKQFPCKVFTGQSIDPGFVFPELSKDGDYAMADLQAKPNFGVCISGGGMRACTSSLGVIRALNSPELNLLSKARYLSSNSGGSWFNSAFSFAFGQANPVSINQFLGAYQPPKELTPQVLDNVGEYGQSFASTVAYHWPPINGYDPVGDLAWKVLAADIEDLFNKNKFGYNPGAWAEAVADLVLRPYGLDKTQLMLSTASSLGTKGQVHVRIQSTAQKIGLEDTYLHQPVVTSNGQDQQLPFPIFMQTILERQDNRYFFPLEWTPLYAGMPANLESQSGSNEVSSMPEQLDSALGQASQGHKLGGGYVEPIGLNSAVVPGTISGDPTSPNGAKITVEFKGPASLGGAVGISSSAIPYALAPKRFEDQLLGGAIYSYWSPQNYQAFDAEMTDGAGVDDPALTPLLRRKVEKIICWVHTVIDPICEDDFAHNSDLAQFFGCYTPGNPPDHDYPNAAIANATRQVFDTAKWKDLWNDISQKYINGGPVWHRPKERLQVLENKFLGIPGGWQADILFMFNCTCKNFTQDLPPETQKLLVHDPQAEHLTRHAAKHAAKKLVQLKLQQADQDQAGQLVNEDDWPNWFPIPLRVAGLEQFPLVNVEYIKYTPQLVSLLAYQSAWATIQALKDDQNRDFLQALQS